VYFMWVLAFITLFFHQALKFSSNSVQTTHLLGYICKNSWWTLFISENTQDPVEDEQQLVRIKEWLNCCHLDTIDLTDVLSNFPDISVVPTISLTIQIMLLFCLF
jgi:hypothetical protein